VYTGNGKGKTTAAIGLAIRALGAEKKVMLLQFMKAKAYSEHNILSTISEDLTVETFGKPFFIVKKGSTEDKLGKEKEKAVIFSLGKPPLEYLKVVNKGVVRAKEVIASGKYDVVILDEIIVALHFNLVTWEQVKDLIDSKGEGMELVLTGRGAIPELIERADLVTEMREVKHYFRQGVEARKGIEK